MTKAQSPNPKSQISKTAFLLLVLCSLLISPVRAQPSPPDPRFGAVEAFRDPVAAAEAGVGWERILFYWSELQPNGPEDWNGYHVPDEWLNLASIQGREVVGLLKHTPAWATDGLPGCSVPRGLDLPVDDPGNLWATFVRRVVGMYAGRIDRCGRRSCAASSGCTPDGLTAGSSGTSRTLPLTPTALSGADQ
jgi:hypothetical protein